MAAPSTVAIAGTGLIGGSIGLALRRGGATVIGYDADRARADAAVEVGAVDRAVGALSEAVAGADVTVVAVPVGRVAAVVIEALDAGAAVVTDVGSVKSPLLTEVATARPDAADRYVGGHPMAGSEQTGVEGADADLLLGATWVLTPNSRTDATAFSAVQSLVRATGAEMLAIPAQRHDELVAIVSHVPQLAATTLMDLAATTGRDETTLLRLAAGGFRDMTRIAASDTSIWPDICLANRDAILGAFDGYLDALTRVRALVADGDRQDLLAVLERARDARRSLPSGARTGETLAELRIPVPDRPGVVAEVATLAGELGVNIADIEIAHSSEGAGGVLVLVVAADEATRFEEALAERGYHSAHTEIS